MYGYVYMYMCIQIHICTCIYTHIEPHGGNKGKKGGRTMSETWDHSFTFFWRLGCYHNGRRQPTAWNLHLVNVYADIGFLRSPTIIRTLNTHVNMIVNVNT